jgi:hypothetical protein
MLARTGLRVCTLAGWPARNRGPTCTGQAKGHAAPLFTTRMMQDRNVLNHAGEKILNSIKQPSTQLGKTIKKPDTLTAAVR